MKTHTIINSIRTFFASLIQKFKRNTTVNNEIDDVPDALWDIFDFAYEDIHGNINAITILDDNPETEPATESEAKPEVVTEERATSGSETIDGITISVNRTEVTPFYDSRWEIEVTQGELILHNWRNVKFYDDEYADVVIRAVRRYMNEECATLGRNNIYYD